MHIFNNWQRIIYFPQKYGNMYVNRSAGVHSISVKDIKFGKAWKTSFPVNENVDSKIVESNSQRHTRA